MESTRVDIDLLSREVADILERHGAPGVVADLVASDLIEGDRCGVPSHGVARTGEYVAAIERGAIRPGAEPVTSQLGTITLVDGGGGFGQLAGQTAMNHAIGAARESGVGVVAVRNSHHMGRVGALCEQATRAGFMALCFVAVGIPGPVAPFGGKEGRLGTNPIAWGVPGPDFPIVADFATAAMPEGAINLRRRTGRVVPEGVLVDSEGRPTTDPNDLYTDPPGAILPFGGPWGHRGFALNLMVELFAGTLSGYGPGDPDRPSNCLFGVVVNPAAFPAGVRAEDLIASTAAFMTSAAPQVGATVILPGQREADHRLANADSIPLDGSTIEELTSLGANMAKCSIY